MLSKPVLALASNRNRLAQTNDFCGDPAEWFDSQAFIERNLYSTSFDFFVDWNKERICDEVWIKRISDSDSIHTQSEEELLKQIAECDGSEKANRVYRFMAHHSIIEKYMLFRDVPENQWATGTEKVVEVDLSRYKNGSVSQYNAQEIQEKIRKLRRKAAPIGNTGLVYSTSTLEGYLSRQAYFWPGDADTVIFDENNNVQAIIEFKKHTANSRIPFADQKITNYLNRDILKYKSLALLRDKFNTKLLVLYYPIPQNINYIIIEKLDGSPDCLFASERYELELPNRRIYAQVRAFVDAFITSILNR